MAFEIVSNTLSLSVSILNIAFTLFEIYNLININCLRISTDLEDAECAQNHKISYVCKFMELYSWF